MIDHVSIGVRDIARTKRFYDAALKPLGYKCLSEGEGSWAMARMRSRSGFQHGSPGARRSEIGSAFLLCRADAAQHEAFHAAALSNGGRDNGTPGLRADYSPDYYAAFVIDPDGYRLEAHCSRSAA